MRLLYLRRCNVNVHIQSAILIFHNDRGSLRGSISVVSIFRTEILFLLSLFLRYSVHDLGIRTLSNFNLQAKSRNWAPTLRSTIGWHGDFDFSYNLFSPTWPKHTFLDGEFLRFGCPKPSKSMPICQSWWNVVSLNTTIVLEIFILFTQRSTIFVALPWANPTWLLPFRYPLLDTVTIYG